MKKIVINIFILLLLVVNKSAGNQRFIHFTVENGLPSNTIYDIYRDQNGYLWFATDKGVARFNGIKFENFTTSDGLADNEIYYFQPDFQGRMWLGTYNGRLCYYENGKFYNSENKPFLRLLYNSRRTEYITLERDSSLTIYFGDRERFISIKNERIRYYTLEGVFNPDSGGRIKHISKLKNDIFELIYENKIVQFNTQNSQIQVLSHLSAPTIRYHKFKDQEFFITKDEVWDRKKRLFTLPSELFNIEANRFYRIYYDSLYNFIGTNLGLFINGKKQELLNERVSSIAKDIDSNYWISTLDNGVFLLKKDFQKLEILETSDEYPVVYSGVNEQDFFYFRSNLNLYSLKSDKNIVKLFDYELFENIPFKHSNTAYYIGKKYSYAIYNQFIYQLNNKNPECVKRVKTNIENVKQVLSSFNRYFVKLGNSIHYFDEKLIAQKEDSIYCPRLSSPYLPYKEILGGFDLSPKGEIWFSTTSGVFKIDSNYVVQPQNQFDKINFRQFKFCKNTLVGITNENNLLVINNYDDRKIIIDTVKDFSCVWDALFEIDSNHLIIKTNNYYRLVSLDNNGASNCSIIEDQFIPRNAEHISAAHNRILFFVKGSITSINKSDLLKESKAPKIIFNSIKTLSDEYFKDSVLHISYSEARNLKISFDAISFSGSNLQFEYRVERLKENEDVNSWQSILNKELVLFNLPFGEYKIHIRAKTLASKFSAPKIIYINIKRPYWATWWFILLIVLTVGGMISLLIFMRIKALIKKNKQAHEKELQVLKSEYKSLNALINPHFIFNALNSVQTLINNNERTSSNKYMKILSDLIRQNMYNVSKELITLQKEMDLVSNYLALEKLRFKEKLHFDIIIDKSIDLEEIMIPPLLIQPLVENAVKHGIFDKETNDGFIEVKLVQSDFEIIITVEDNGNGFAKESKDSSHESFGLQNIKQRLDQLNAIYNIRFSFEIEELKGENNLILGVRSTIKILLDY